MTDQFIEQIRSTLRDAMTAVDGLEAAQGAMDSRPKVELPTEPGIYTDGTGDSWILHSGGGWFHLGDGSYSVPYEASDFEGMNESSVPCVRLEPVHVTAKRVLAEVRRLRLTEGTQSFTVTHHTFENVAADFGVTDD